MVSIAMNVKNGTISGKNYNDVLEKLMKRLSDIKKERQEEYLKMASEASKDNVKKLLLKIANLQRKSQLNIGKLLWSGEIKNIGNDSSSFEMIEHLVDTHDNYNPNDIKDVLIASIKEEEQFQSLINLVSKEYQNTTMESLLRSLYNCEEESKNYLSELYEEYINENYW